MRIVYCSTPPFSDSDIPLLKSLSEAGNEVFFFIHLAPYSLKTTLFDIREQIPRFGIFSVTDYPELSFFLTLLPGVKIFIVNNPAGKNSLNALRLCRREARIIGDINPDVIHYIETPAPFHLPMLWKHRKKVVCTIHDPVPHLNEMKKTERLCRIASSLFLRKIVLLNDRQTDAFCRQFHFDKSRVFYSVIGAYEYLSLWDSAEAAHGRYILIFGRITPYKGIDNGINAITEISRFFPDVRLIVAGAGEIYFDKSLYEGKPYLEMRHRFIPTSEQVSLIKHSLFVLCPYTEATQSGVIQSAFGLNTPVVVTDVGALADSVHNGVDGLVVPGNDLNALTNAIRELLENPAKLERMRDNIRRGNETGDHSWSSIAQNYLSIYRA